MLSDRVIPETILENLVFPECPRWRNGELYFSDQHDSKVWVMNRTGKARLLVEVPGHPSGLDQQSSFARSIHDPHFRIVLIGEIKLAVAPAGAFGEDEIFENRFRNHAIRKHSILPLRIRQLVSYLL